MPEDFLSLTYDEIFTEFDLKIKFLPGEPYKFFRKETCKAIDVSPENLINYLNKTKPLSREKLVDMLRKLNDYYSEVWKRSEFLPDSLIPYVPNDEPSSEVEHPVIYHSLSLDVQALMEMFFEVLSRLEGKTIEQLHEQFLRKKEDIAGRPDNRPASP